MGKKEKKKEIQTEGADFENAISATGFGKFNYLLLIIAGPACLATVYETSTMSYILPSAECDLQLTLIDKGFLNAITYAGMITSPLIWGFAADTLGRKKLLVFGFLLDALCVLFGSISQTKYVLMTFKYLGGCLMCGPFAVLMSYVTEFHGAKHRARVMMCMGIYFSLGTLTLPLIAWGILPNEWTINIFDFLVLHSWQIFIAASAIPSLLAGITIVFLPESPKFLMSQGRNDEALEIFKKIFAMNQGKPKEEYPVKSLLNELTEKTEKNEKQNLNLAQVESGNEKEKKSFKAGLEQIMPMFHKPHLSHSLLVYVIQFCMLMGSNTFRLWLPQLFTSIAEFEEYHENTANITGSLCSIIEYSVNKSEKNIASIALEDYVCTAKVTNNTFINNIIVGITGLVGYLVAGSVINALGNKNIIIIGMAIGGSCAIVLFWAKSSLAVLVLSSVTVTIGSICSTALLGIIVNLFPTTLRTMIVSISMMFGRLGALIGNILFPYFMSMGCLPPFILIGLVLIASSILCILLPKTHKIALK